MKALLKDCHQSPQKVRLVANVIRGKSVQHARAALTFLPRKASEPMMKLLNSAVANVANFADVAVEDLIVKTVEVNKGIVMRRVMPKSRGRAQRYAHTLSIISLELAARPGVHVHMHGDTHTHDHAHDHAAEAVKAPVKKTTTAKKAPAAKKPAAKKPRATTKK